MKNRIELLPKQFHIAALSLGLVLTLCSCGLSSGLGGESTSGEDSYIVVKDDGVVSEYPRFVLVQRESRKIYVAGTIPSGASTFDYRYVWWTYSFERSAQVSVGSNTTNTYYDANSGSYTVPLTLDPTSLFGLTRYAFTLHIGRDYNASLRSNTFEVDLVSRRELRIEYSYQSG